MTTIIFKHNSKFSLQKYGLILFLAYADALVRGEKLFCGEFIKFNDTIFFEFFLTKCYECSFGVGITDFKIFDENYERFKSYTYDELKSILNPFICTLKNGAISDKKILKFFKSNYYTFFNS